MTDRELLAYTLGVLITSKMRILRNGERLAVYDEQDIIELVGKLKSNLGEGIKL